MHGIPWQILANMNRDICIDRLYEEVRKHVPISRSVYGDSLCGWVIDPVVVDGEMVGILLLHGREIHLQIEKQQALVHMRSVIKQCAVMNLKRFGYLTTRADADDKSTLKFLHRLGFYKTGMDGKLTVYRLDTLKIK